MKTTKVILYSIFLLVSNLLYSQDRLFTYTYQTTTLPKGVKDLEVWNTYRTGRENFFHRLDQRMEFEVGVTDNLQTAVYVNASNKATGVKVNDSTMILTKSSSLSFSNEWKYKISDPVASPIGFGIYGEIGLAAHEIEWEAKLLFDKKFGNNLWAFNIVGEYEIEYGAEGAKIEGETEKVLEFDMGFIHLFNSSFGLGIEARNHNEFVEKDGWEHSPLFAGPVMSFSGDKYFINFTLLPQLINFHKHEGETSNLDLTEHEKLEMRMLIGFSF
ncbi:MAG: hypothetical protein A3G23_01320 [Bacteroidetes bacterium RIFCSPLOWO2_12_FULL_37_12]|nr:MAG: hypothetical protein A3G23_01320 [Bacteroidetes bacterium RIFCSPLOWO2_12_FULL_37_12]